MPPHREGRAVTALALFFATTVAIAVSAPKALPVDELAPGVFVHVGAHKALDAQGHDDIANLGFVVGTRCVAVIDTGGSVRTGRALLAAVRVRTALPVCHVISTHGHVDHVLGNAAFRGEGTTFTGHANLAASLERSRELFARDYADDLEPAGDASAIVAPTNAVTGTQQLDLGGRTLTLRAWPLSHTDADLSVFDDASGTLWTGDLLFRERLPAIEGSATGWLAVDAELARLPGVRHVVPGHGATTADLAGALARQDAYLRALVDDIRAALKRGDAMQDVIVKAGHAQRRDWQLWDETHPRNVARVYQALEWE
ncbi:quinoprotein relay system zinc metallohydrolase 2 [Dokdonella sp. MW10]|uniref:quinoprotein relay system zinc metallohydrolase 2 n=1 Tax=Dokdonella sp. MW10 TaxID=2992926 RepID=UPI003F7CDB49